MKAEIEIECESPDLVVRALRPEIGETKKFTVKLEAGNDRLKLSLEAEDVPGLLAGINSYLRLIKTSMDGLEA